MNLFKGLRNLVADKWEEHCVECGAPACYATCPRYEALKDGRCRRFERDEKVRLPNGSKGRLVEFRPWGKMELLYRGKMHVHGPLGRLFRLQAVPSLWVVDCELLADVTFVASIVQDENEVFSRTLSFRKGRNRVEMLLPPVGKYARFRFYPLGESNVSVVFRVFELATAPAVLPGGASPAKFIKCVAWDLDNTLWSGILSEDGVDGVTPRPEAVAALKTLDSRGIVNTVSSKNDFAPAISALKAFGLEEYFVFPQINWGPKSESIRRAAKEIGIGVDTFAFIDDSAHERGEVAANLPMVRVFGENEIAQLLSCPAANPAVSSESAKRRLSYRAEMLRRNAQEAEYGGDRMEFLRNSGIKLTCGRLSSDELRVRCRELVQRTNQLTLAGRRYTEEEFSALVDSPGVSAYAIHCRDRYGDYGIVGFIALERAGDEARVREFVMSCRVAKKFCEQSVLLFVSRCDSTVVGARRLVAEVRPTGRNAALVEAFDAMPFDLVEESADRRIYCLPLDKGVDFGEVFSCDTEFGELSK